MEDRERVSLTQAAYELKMAPQGLREYMKRGLIDIGVALPDLGQGKTHRYVITRTKLDAFIGRTADKEAG